VLRDPATRGLWLLAVSAAIACGVACEAPGEAPRCPDGDAGPELLPCGCYPGDPLCPCL